MKRAIVFLILGIFIKPLFSQETYFFEPLGSDSIKIYFDKFGDLTPSNKSEFYRIGKMDTFYFSFSGEVKDYNNKNELLFVGHYTNGKLNGLAKYYKDGLLTETGTYTNDIRDSIWTYYANNQVEKKVDFSNNNFRILELYSKKGVSQIVNGICTYKDNVCAYKNSVKVPVKGNFKNGLLDGKWIYGSSYTEYYKDGEFIKGIDNGFGEEYYGKPKLKLINFNPSEFTNFYYNYFSILNNVNYKDECMDTLFFPRYSGNGDLNTSFFKSLIDSVVLLYNSGQEGNYYLAEIGISKSNRLKYVRLFSPQKNNKSDSINEIINNLNKWKTSWCENKVFETQLYFPVIIENKTVIIPQYTGFYRDEMLNTVFTGFLN